MRKTNPKSFYRNFKKSTKAPKNISAEQFLEHFKDLASPNEDSASDETDAIPGDPVFQELDLSFSEQEIFNAIKNLNRDKSSGINCVLNEYFIEFSAYFVPKLCHLFNCILSSGYFPESWSQGMIVPVHKKAVWMTLTTFEASLLYLMYLNCLHQF